MENYDLEYWNFLKFKGFDPEVLKVKKEIWEQYAKEVLQKLKNKNVALVADTSAGKTVISALAVFASNYKCLFLAPTRYLCDQHKKLFDNILGYASATKVITGITTPQKRLWKDLESKVVFATPHVVLKDLQKEILPLNFFDLIIIDEFHKASGNYPYVEIVEKLSLSVKIMGLSASPGDSEKKINDVEKNCRIQDWIIAQIETPAKLKDLVYAEQDEIISVLSGYFEKLLKETLEDIQELMPKLKINPEKELLYSFDEAEEWKRKSYLLHTERQRRMALFLIAKYVKIYHSYSVCIKESYYTFLSYAEELKKQKAKSAQNLLKNVTFKRIVEICGAEINNHPKVLMLLKVLKSWISLDKNAIVFVNQKKTGEYLKNILLEEGIKAENIYGGGGKRNLKKQEEALQKISQGNLNVIISTSVIEEGISVPEVNMIINYSRPSTGVGSKQRDGRTARLNTGNVINLIIRHPLDEKSHWISQNKVKGGEKAVINRSKKQTQLTLFSDKEKLWQKK